ncbi:MAG: DNA polymerase Y family protein [Acidobacteriota bacterium]|nr:DNA polymerase Y family protein [Acidobacteriota bacterium]
MKVPSYNDLTPGISDVHPRDTFNEAARMLQAPHDPVVPHRAAPSTTPHPAAPSTAPHPVLFACLRARGSAAPGLLSLAKDFSPRLERYGDDAIVLDVGGLGRLLGDAHGIAAALQQTAVDRGVKVRVAVAPSQTAARLLTLDQDVTVVTDDVAAVLAPLPLTLLEIESGKNLDRTLDALRRWGIRTIGEFAALPADELAARFGAAGVALHRVANGIDPRPLVPDPGVPRFVQSMELEWPLDELEPLSFVLARLLDPLALALERADRGAAAIRLDLRLVDRSTHTRMLQLPAPMRDPRVLRTLLLLDLESHPPSAAIDIVTIEVDPAPARIVQFSLLERAIPSPETLATLTARLGALVGEDRCGTPVPVDSYRPDAFEMHRFNPSDRAPLRIPRTLESPNPGTLEPLPHGNSESRNPGALEFPSSGTLLLRRFRPAVAVRVGVERGRPASVAIDRRGMPGGRVNQAAGPWRTSGDWWNTSGRHWDRDEWEVGLSDGSVCRLYLDRETGRWFLDGIFD